MSHIARSCTSGRDERFRLARCGTHDPFAFGLGIGERARRFLCSTYSFSYFFATFIDDAQQRLVEQVCEERQEQSEIHRLYDKQFPIDPECCEKLIHIVELFF